VRRLLHGGRATQRRIYATYLFARAALGLGWWGPRAC
jgi:hypothetical protein